MIHCAEIQTYLDYCRDYPNEVPKRIHQAIENVILPTLERDDVFFDENTYRECLKYVERYYYPLFPYQKFIYAFFFMYFEGQVLFRTIIIIMGRGNGKDGFIAPLVNFLQTKKYGVKKYHIDIVANAEQQAQDTFDVVHDMMTDKVNYPFFKKYFYITREKIVNLSTMSRLRFNTSNAGTKDGKQTGLILYNEYHGYDDNKQISTFESGFGKVKHCRKIIISTQGHVRGGPLDELMDTCDYVLKGEYKELKYLPFIYTLDDPNEVDEMNKWVKANPSIHYRQDLKNELITQYHEMKIVPSKRAEFMTKRMNIPERDEKLSVTNWVNILATTYQNPEAKESERIIRLTMKLERKSCVAAIDYASVRDFASAGFLFKDDDEWIWRQKTWVCRHSSHFDGIKFPLANQGNPGFEDFEVVSTPTIPAELIVEWVMEESKKYDLQAIAMDGYRFELMKQAFEKYNVIPRTKEDPYQLLVLVRSGPITHNLVAPMIDVAFANRLINFGNSAIMRWYTNNTMVITDRKGNMAYEKIEPKLRKNDGFMAFVHAMTQRELLEEVVLYM
ncbi:MAG: terminase [Firmicutes bacterium HGW-Firmicutes-15]|jgi:phage terminase large subunit-like protein|nr:MAG: terminase [Firmicutes bacterium HGW-Firmicutes-15]